VETSNVKNLILIVVAILVSQTGCSMCCGPFDNDYGAFGGKHLRADRSHGRVGSNLSDPITSLAGPSADSNLSEPPAPDSGSDSSEDDDLDRDDSDSPELEDIEPLRDTDTLPAPAEDKADDSTASTRWRPRPLR